MTLSDIKQSDKTMLTPADVAPVLGVNPQTIRNVARDNPKRLGFNVVVVGRTTMIPREAFIRFMEGVST